MKPLKVCAIAAVAILVVMLLMLGYLFLSAEVTVSVVGAEMVSAEMVPQFAELKESLIEDTFIGTVYQKPSQWKQPADYAYVTYTVHVNNGCLVPIEMIEVQVVPQPSDIAQIGNVQNASLKAKSEGDLTTTILASAGGNPARELIVSYYVWGVSFQLRTIAGK
ncbi:MAG: hypothetical protein E7323_05075 [Clostridiales bacterium]|nr:hypothetical protein [Clostridiales bacterium]